MADEQNGGAATETTATATKTEQAPAKDAKVTTLAGTGAEQGAQQQPEPVTEDWRLKYTTDEEDLKTLGRFKSEAGVWRAFKEQRKLIGETRPLPPKPPADSPPEVIAEWRKLAGLPETPDGYFPEGKLPDGRLIGEGDKELFTDYAAYALENGWKQEDVAKQAAWFFDSQERLVSKIREQDQKDNIEGQVALRAAEEWGPDFDKNLSALGRLKEEIGEETFDLITGARLGNGKLLGNDVAAVKVLAKLATELYPQHTWMPAAGSGARTIDDEIAGIEKVMRENNNAYWKDEKMRARYGELLNLREKAKARAA